MIQMLRSKPHADVLRRVFDVRGHGMTDALAQSILARDFPAVDTARFCMMSRAASGVSSSKGIDWSRVA
jgi:hypothetical protein